jgi:hypothetical protein
MTKLPILLAAFVFALLLPLPAQAQLTRTYVSQAGHDSNPCTATQPCRHFANALAATAANGIITALDPGGYGPVTIAQGITINGQGWGSITAPSGGDGIDINAGASDRVTLIGLTVDGAGAGANGIAYNSGGHLTITNCLVQNFVIGNLLTGNGILIDPSSGSVGLVITDSIISNNALVGIFYAPSGGAPNANLVIDHVVVTDNNDGMIFSLGNTSGGSTIAAISNSVFSRTPDVGIAADSGPGPLKISIDSTNISSNASYGIQTNGNTNMILGRSVITGNGTGVQNNTSPNTFYTLKDNRINLNGTDVSGTALNTTFALQ